VHIVVYLMLDTSTLSSFRSFLPISHSKCRYRISTSLVHVLAYNLLKHSHICPQRHWLGWLAVYLGNMLFDRDNKARATTTPTLRTSNKLSEPI